KALAIDLAVPRWRRGRHVAWRHVHNGRRIIASQCGLVEQLRATGRDASDAERTLELFERSQAMSEDHLRRLEAERELHPSQSHVRNIHKRAGRWDPRRAGSVSIAVSGMHSNHTFDWMHFARSANRLANSGNEPQYDTRARIFFGRQRYS